MSFSRQFLALLRKNLLLQTRARKNWLGLTSWGALALEILLPVAFFLILWLPRQFAPLPRPTPVQLSVPLPLESNAWGEIYTGAHCTALCRPTVHDASPFMIRSAKLKSGISCSVHECLHAPQASGTAMA